MRRHSTSIAPQSLLFPNVRVPAISRSHGGVQRSVQRGVGVGEPLGTGVVEVCEGALAEFAGGFLVSGEGAGRVTGGGLLRPFDLFRRAQPPAAQFDEAVGMSGERPSRKHSQVSAWPAAGGVRRARFAAGGEPPAAAKFGERATPKRGRRMSPHRRRARSGTRSRSGASVSARPASRSRHPANRPGG